LATGSKEIVPSTAPKNQAIQTAAAPAKSLGELVHKLSPTIVKCLPQHLSPDRMSRVALSALRTTKHLAECTQASFGASLLGASLLGLEPNTPLQQCWLVPYYNKGVGAYECQLMIGYQGQLELARRSGKTASITASAVMRDDYFEYELGLEPRLVHRPNPNVDRDDINKLTHVYAVCRLKDKDADPIFVVLTRAQVERRRNRGANGPAWRSDPIPMALKTAVRALFPWIPKSSEMALAAALDERFDSGKTPVAVVGSVLDDAQGSTLETMGLDLTASDDDAPEEQANNDPAQESAEPARTEKVQAALTKARSSIGKRVDPPHDPVTGEVLDPDNDGR